MLRCSRFLTLLLLMSPAIGFAKGVPNGESPAFTPIPELSAGFDLLYEQKFAEAAEFSRTGNPAIARLLLVRWPWRRAIFLRRCTSKAY